MTGHEVAEALRCRMYDLVLPAIAMLAATGLAYSQAISGDAAVNVLLAATGWAAGTQATRRAGVGL